MLPEQHLHLRFGRHFPLRETQPGPAGAFLGDQYDIEGVTVEQVLGERLQQSLRFGLVGEEFRHLDQDCTPPTSVSAADSIAGSLLFAFGRRFSVNACCNRSV